MTFQRRTFAREASFQGLGLHSGTRVKATIYPGEAGIRFRCGTGLWEANPENVTDTSRSTKLGEIGTVEHLMSALAALEVTDADVVVTAPELPSMDGSAGPFFEALSEVGFEVLADLEIPKLFSRVFVQDRNAKIAISAGTGHWRYEFQTGDRWPGEQIWETERVVEHYQEIAFARTFGFEEELPMIRAAGLAKGLDESSALVLGSSGYLNDARFANEPVRHKMVDAIGDVYLAGIPIRFLNVVAERTGHTATVKAAALLYEQRSR